MAQAKIMFFSFIISACLITNAETMSGFLGQGFIELK